MRPLRIVIVALLSLALAVALAGSATAAGVSKLVEIRAAHHPGFDRIVFEFTGPVPDVTKVTWATELRLDPSHKLAHVQGNAYLRVRFYPAVAHDQQPPMDSSFGPARRAYALPNIAHVVLLGDFEGEVSFGIGLMKKKRILRATTLRRPSRFVIDVATDYKKANAKVFLVDWPAVVAGEPPLTVPVERKVPRGGKANGALLRLFAGPTRAEARKGLQFVASGATGFRDLSVNPGGVARVTLRGPCDSGGSAVVTIANEIRRTLRRLPSIDWVKIYDREGVTEQPYGKTDSIPFCLEP